MNKWIRYGLLAFLVYVLLVASMMLMVDAPSSGLLPYWTQILLLILRVLFYVLPIVGIAACLYGLYRINATNETGKFLAIGTVIIFSVIELITLFG